MGHGSNVRRGRRRAAAIAATLALVLGLVTVAALPLTSVAGKKDESDPVGDAVENVQETVDRVTEEVQDTVDGDDASDGNDGNDANGGGDAQSGPQLPLPTGPSPAAQDPGSGSSPRSSPPRAPSGPSPEYTSNEPTTEPPLHGTNPHGQGAVGVIDIAPSSERPLGGDPAGSDSGEEIVVGRSRGEQRGGDYHGHITVLAIAGTELVGVDTEEGETDNGPLGPLNDELAMICTDSGGNLCLAVLAMESKTTDDGSQNSYQTLGVAVGGPTGIAATFAESEGNISEDGDCQTSRGRSSVANVQAGGTVVADLVSGSSRSRACRGGESSVDNESSVIQIGGVGVPFPAPGCADGTPDTETGVPPLAPVICNGDDRNGDQADSPYGVRDPLDVFVLENPPILKVGVGDPESLARPPDRDRDRDRDRNRNRDNDDDDDDDAPEAVAVVEPPPAGPPGEPPIGPPDEPEGPDGPGGPGGPDRPDKGLPFTGADLVSVVMLSLLLLAGGLLLRIRRIPGR